MNKYRKKKLMYEVRHGHFRKVSELVSTYGLSHLISHGYVLLCAAIKRGHKKIAKLLLKKGAKINTKSKKSFVTPLHLAAKEGYIEITKKLLDRGADIDARDSYHGTPLDYALNNRKVKVAKLLLNRNADIDMSIDYNALHFAADQGHEEIAKLVINKCSRLDAKTGCGLTIFHISNGTEYEMLLNLMRTEDYVDVQDKHKYDYTSLRCTVQCTNAKDAQLFLKQNAHNVFITINRNVLYIPVRKDDSKTTQTLLLYTYPRIDVGEDYGLTPLHLSATKGHEVIVKLLLQAGANVDIKDHYGKTALSIAIEKGYSVIVEDILKYSSDLNSDSNKSIFTKVVSGWQGPYQKIIELLLQYGAIAVSEDAGSSEILLAILEKGYVNIVPDLIKNGADVNVKRRCDNLTPLHFAVEQDHLETIKLLLDRGANVNATGKYNTTPLHIAVQKNSMETIKLLLSRGADVNAAMYIHKIFPGQQESKESNINSCPKFRTSALHFAVHKDEIFIAEILIKFGADIDCRDHDGRTTFHIACKVGSTPMFLMILDYGCDVNAVCNLNETPLQYALRCYEKTKNKGIEIIVSPYGIRYDKSLKVMNILYRIIKMKIANLYVSEQNLTLVPQEIINDYQNTCENEIKIMKCTKIGISNVSFSNILIDDINRLVMYAKNENIVEVLESNNYYTIFPTYAGMIHNYFKKGMERKKLQEQGEKFFYPSIIDLPFKLPHNCVDKILYYLSNKDLKILIDIYKSVRNT